MAQMRDLDEGDAGPGFYFSLVFKLKGYILKTPPLKKLAMIFSIKLNFLLLRFFIRSSEKTS